MRVVVGISIVLLLGGNGLAMLLCGPWWYQAAPGVVLTGPYNAHFVRDIGMAYLTCAGAVAWWLARPALAWPAAATAGAFLTLHGLIHLFDAVCGSNLARDLGRDLGVLLPPLIIFALLARPFSNRSSKP